MQAIKIIGVVILLLALNACAKSDDSVPAVGAQDSWIAFNGNPVISEGDAFSMAQWNDPTVIESGGTFTMYMTANSTGAYGVDVLPYLATSTDGTNWTINPTPLLALGMSGSFDEIGVETPSVVFFGGEYHMYYTGVGIGGLGGPLSIGHATSPDGLTWTKDAAVLNPSGTGSDWNGIQVAEPGAVVFNGTVYLYFAAIGFRPSGTPLVKRTIGLATSANGYIFNAPTMVLEQSARYPAASGYSGYSTPSAFELNSQLHLVYDVVEESAGFVQVALEHAVSADGLTWTEDSAPIFTRSDFIWTDREIRSPFVLLDGSTLKMWFAGDDVILNALWGIGYATVADTIY